MSVMLSVNMGVYTNMKSLQRIIFVLCVVCMQPVCAQTNPFMQFAGKPYGSYHYALRDTLRKRYYGGNAAFAEKTFRQMLDVPDKNKDKQWELEARYFRANYYYKHFHDSATFDREMRHLYSISCAAKNKVFRVIIIRRLFDFYREKEPLNGIEYALKLEKALNTVTSKEYPDVIDGKFRLGEFYLSFFDYQHAEKLFRETIDAPYEPKIYQIFIHARNDMGLICRDYYHNLDASDRWFRSMNTFRAKHHVTKTPEEYDALSFGNVGRNEILRHHYDKALVLLKNALKIMLPYGERNYSFELSNKIALCYCHLGQYDEAKNYLQVADDCRKLIGDSVGLNRLEYFQAKSNYFIGTHHPEKAQLYLDSIFTENKRLDEHFGPNQFLKVERRVSEMELQREQEARTATLHRFFVSLSVALLSIIFLTLYIILYLKKRSAYRSLVKKNINWANGKQNTDSGNPNSTVGERGKTETELRENEESQSDIDILEEIKKYMQSTECYLNQEITLDDVAKGIFSNRTYVSSAINKNYKNFNSLINEYRVKYAIRSLSETPDIPFKDLAWNSGFNTRKSFYNAFKTVTGLSPSDFKTNMTHHDD